ncbi:peptide ABC transporter substrate-binding protein [Staphylococcus sp. HMSC69H07]|uniref:peptide ABC transporter substrate-binding protein n=1 Tax=Staphylococcus sp. HMSC69H07 TaxID=1608894 RepID=UPI0008A88783|nr:peptide ABC transporter substrate-binding protein [Staphylococcus sp. HMSC69H07]OHS53857.1 peptide ABC transporter substrate-binding protein [Staphylococcus sp. HMSC69H07]
MKKLMSILAFFLVTSTALTGCGNKESLYSDKGNVFRKVLTQDMSSLDTGLITEEISFEVTAQAFEGLYVLGRGDKAELGVAQDFPKKSNGGKTLTVKLKKDAKWSNGDPVTAQDFVYAWRKVVNPKTGSEFAYIMNDIKNASQINTGKKPVKDLGIKALDSHTLKIDLEKPIPYINQLLALNTFDPQNEKIAKKYGESYGTKANKAVYNGPFKVDQWKPEDKIMLSKNDKYWDRDKVKLDKVNYKVLKDQQAGASLYDTGSIDDTTITADQVNKYKKSSGLKYRLTSGTFFIKMNEKEFPAFKNKNLRLAIAQSINKQGFVDSVKNNGSTPANTFTAKGVAKSPNNKDFASTIDSELKYNPKSAKSHWDKAKNELGKNQIAFSMNTEDTPDAKIAAEYIKSQVEKNLPGVTLKIKQLPFKQRVNLELTENFQASLGGWSADYPDPTAYLEIMTTGNAQNNTDWGNKKYDSLIKSAKGDLLQKTNERYQAMKQAEELLLDDASVAPIYQKGEAHLMNPQVKNFYFHKVGPYYSLKQVYIDKSIDRETGKKK